MNNFTGKTSFEQWFSPISSKFFNEMVENLQLDYYTKKLYMAPFMKLLLFAQLHEKTNFQNKIVKVTGTQTFMNFMFFAINMFVWIPATVYYVN